MEKEKKKRGEKNTPNPRESDLYALL